MGERRERGALARGALLHDFDYEMHPTLDKHLQDGAPILREEGLEEVVETVLSHAEHLELPRDTPLKKTLFACDELAGFVHAQGSCGLTDRDLEPKSVKKKLKQPPFAAGVHRRGLRRRRALGPSSTTTSERRRGDAADRAGARAPHRGGVYAVKPAWARRASVSKVLRIHGLAADGCGPTGPTCPSE